MKLLLIIFLVGFTPGIVQAQAFSLHEALTVALSKSPGMQASQYELDYSQTRAQGMLSNLTPQVKIQGDWQWEEQPGLQLTMSQFLPWSTTRREISQQAEWELLKAELEQKKGLTDLIFELKEAYFALAKAQIKVDIAEASWDVGHRQIMLVQDKVENGLAAPIDLLKSQGELLGLEQDIIREERRRMEAQVALNRLLGWDLEKIVVLETDFNPDYFQLDYLQDIDDAWANRVEIRLAQLEIERLNLDMEIQEAQGASISIYGKYAFEPVEIGVNVQDKLVIQGKTNSRNSHGWEVGVSWELDLHSKVEHDRQELQIRVAQAQLRLQEMKSLIKSQVYTAYLRIKESAGQIDMAKQRLRQAEEMQRIVRMRYESGLVLDVELLRANIDLAQSQMALQESWIDYQSALAKREAVLGGGW